MANFDVAVGITQPAFNGLLDQYYSKDSGAMPFKGNITKTIPLVGSVLLTWQVGVAPTVTFGAPTLAVWNAALDSSGKTNLAAGNPLPTGMMLQLCIPTLQADYTIAPAAPVGGTTQNVYGYATVSVSGSAITITLVAIALNESNFSLWDLLIFNGFFVPQIFTAVQTMLSVINLPTLTYDGITLNPPAFSFASNNTLLIAASCSTTNTTPLDISGVTWPSDTLFVLASSALINSGLTAFTQTLVNKPYTGSGVFHALGSDLADYDYSVTITSLTATWSAATPGQVTATVVASPSFGGSLTSAGMALAVTAGCALCSGQGQMHPHGH